MSKKSNATRTAILEAARAEFAEHGLAGARVDRVAERAGVNKERLYRHFGSKDGLFDVVMAQMLQEFAAVAGPPAQTGDPGDYVARLYDYYSDHPEKLRLLLWEGLGGHTPEAGHREHYGQRVAAFAEALGLPPGAEAARLLFTLCGIAGWPLAVPQVAALMLGEESPATPEGRARMRDFLIRFARAHSPATEPTGQSIDHDGPVNMLTGGGAVDVAEAAEGLRQARSKADAAGEVLAEALRTEHAAGVSANRLARQVSGVMSRPVVLRVLADRPAAG
ncbi:TetR family transcriptional regulator [Streptomyces sp. NPDC007164]|uniref:TetR/AcrR family transcriptional regulator n=1 Tax=Streptomyces sp. NPDC007164 TaxID=3156918 RepID=UPI0033E38534